MTPNVHPSVYPKLIALWNKGPRHYRDYLCGWGFTHGECEKILDKLREWAIVEYANTTQGLNEPTMD
jgi:hypothetical protein